MKMSKEEWIAVFNDIIDALTWKRFGLLALFTILAVAGVMLFDSRTTIFNRLFDTTPVERQTLAWDVSEETKQQLIQFATTRNIGGVLLTEVNLVKNSRNIKFWHTNDSAFKQQVITVVSTLLSPAFFDYDTNNTKQMLALLDSKFICNPSQDTVFIRSFPDIQTTHPVICRIAVPPFRGKFAGIFTVLLTKTPTQSEIDSLKIEVTQISIEMYLRDLQKSQRSES